MRIPLPTRIVSYGLALLLAAALLISPFRTGIVCGDSMTPTFMNHQAYLLDRTYYQTHEPEQGDVVVVRHNGINLIKRISAVAGDVVHLVHYTDVEMRAVIASEDIPRMKRLISMPRYGVGYELETLRIPDGTCFLLGDNPEVSEDSRAFGPVSTEEIVGKVLTAPPGGQSGDYRADAPVRRDRS